MTVLIVEDEPQAAQRLERVIKELETDWIILNNFDSIKRTVRWLKDNPSPDLIFMDIQLADGLSFEIFDTCEISAPIIFTTAFNEYALKAFKVNSIDYILKPVDASEVAIAIEKFKKITRPFVTQSKILESIGQAMQMLTHKYKERFMIKVGEHLKTIEVSNILYFYSHEKVTFCYTSEGRNFIIDFTVEKLAEILNPAQYFQVNRRYLISPPAIKDIVSYSNSRLKLILQGSQDFDIIVARERVQEFKEWLDR